MKTKNESKQSALTPKSEIDKPNNTNPKENHKIVSINKKEAIAEIAKKHLDSLNDIMGDSILSEYLKSDSSNTRMTEILQDQLAAAHQLCMMYLGAANKTLSNPTIYYVKAATRLMSMCQNAAQVIQKLQTGGQQTILVQHQNVQVNGGQAMIANELCTKAVGGGDDDKK